MKHLLIMKKSGIYKIENLRNGKAYIGSSIDIQSRWRAHKSLLRRNIHPNQHLQRAFNLEGEDSFCFEILEIVNSSSLLLEKERFYTEKYNALDSSKGYNTLTPERVKGTFHHSEITKKKISNSSKGIPRPLSESHRRAITEANRKKRLGKTYEDIYGEKKAKELKKECSLRAKKLAEENIQRLSGKTYEEIYGKEKAGEIKKKQSIAKIGKAQSSKKRELCRQAKLGVRNPMYKELPAAERAGIVSRYKKGILRSHIGKEMKISSYIVGRVLHEEGLL